MLADLGCVGEGADFGAVGSVGVPVSGGVALGSEPVLLFPALWRAQAGPALLGLVGPLLVQGWLWSVWQRPARWSHPGHRHHRSPSITASREVPVNSRERRPRSMTTPAVSNTTRRTCPVRAAASMSSGSI